MRAEASRALPPPDRSRAHGHTPTLACWPRIGSSIYRGARCHGEVLHLDGGAWREAGELVSPRCGLAVAADARSSSFFALGGYAGGTRYLSTAEAFDTATGKSTPIPSMGVARSGPGAAVGPDGALYVVGGSSDGCVSLRSAQTTPNHDITYIRPSRRLSHPSSLIFHIRDSFRYSARARPVRGQPTDHSGCGRS